jgi:hypothetical protein
MGKRQRDRRALRPRAYSHIAVGISPHAMPDEICDALENRIRELVMDQQRKILARNHDDDSMDELEAQFARNIEQYGVNF